MHCIVVSDNATTNAELEAAARRIQAAARRHNAQKPPLLPDDSESTDETQSDDGTPPTKRDSGTPPPKRTELRLELQSDSVAEATQHQDRTIWEEQALGVLRDATTPESETSPTESEPGRVKQSVSAVLSRADAEIGYGTVLKIAEEARRQSPSWTLKSEASSTVLEQQTADAVANEHRSLWEGRHERRDLVRVRVQRLLAELLRREATAFGRQFVRQRLQLILRRQLFCGHLLCYLLHFLDLRRNVLHRSADQLRLSLERRRLFLLLLKTA